MPLQKINYQQTNAPINVVGYGAVGDGTTDDTAAIQAAIDTGRPVFFPVGTYKVTSTLTSSGLDFVLYGQTFNAMTEKNTAETNFTGSVIAYYGSNSTPAINPTNTATTNQIAISNLTISAPKTLTTSIVKIPGTTFTTDYSSNITMENVRIETRGWVEPPGLAGYTMTGLELDCTNSWSFGSAFTNIYIFGVQTGIKVIANAGFFNSNTFTNIKQYQVYRGLSLKTTLVTDQIYANLFDGFYVQPNTQLGVNASGVILIDGNVTQNVFNAPNVYDTTSGVSYLTINNGVRWGKENIMIGAQANDIVNGGIAYPGWGLQSNGTFVNKITQTFIADPTLDPNQTIWVLNDQTTGTWTFPRNGASNGLNFQIAGLGSSSFNVNGASGSFYAPRGFGTSLVTNGSVTYTVPAAATRIINTSGSAATYTLPSPINGTELTINTQGAAVSSATSNVYPLAGGSLGTAILPATAGKWANLVADGTNWYIVSSN